MRSIQQTRCASEKGNVARVLKRLSSSVVLRFATQIASYVTTGVSSRSRVLSVVVAALRGVAYQHEQT